MKNDKAVWGRYKSFTKEEFNCRHTGKNEMRDSFMQKLQYLRNEWGKPLTVTSGYRDPSHPVEAAKKGRSAGEHTTGCAADVLVSALDRYAFVRLAMRHGFTRIGIADTFIHLGTSPLHPNPRIWTY